MGIDVPPGLVSGGCDIATVGMYLSSGAGVTGGDPVGVIGKAGVEDEMTGDGDRAGCIAASLPATTGGTDGGFDKDCCGGWMRYVGLFIISCSPLIPLRDVGLAAPGNGRE